MTGYQSVTNSGLGFNLERHSEIHGLKTATNEINRSGESYYMLANESRIEANAECTDETEVLQRSKSLNLERHGLKTTTNEIYRSSEPEPHYIPANGSRIGGNAECTDETEILQRSKVLVIELINNQIKKIQKEPVNNITQEANTAYNCMNVKEKRQMSLKKIEAELKKLNSLEID